MTQHSKKHHGKPLQTIRDTTKLTKEKLEQNYTPPVIDSNASLKQACNQFNEELHKMLDRAASQTSKVCRQTRQTLIQKLYSQTKRQSKTEIESTKITEKNITREPTPLKK